MQRVAALTQRELAASFFSPVAYVVATVFLVATGYLFMSTTLIEGGEASVRPLLDSMAWLLIFAIPMLTMRALSEEFSTGTIEALMTAPVTDIEVVFGKFLGVLIFYAALLLTTLFHVILLLKFGKADLGVIFYGYVGMLLLGALYVAVGVFASAITKYHLVAALIAMGVLCIFSIVVDSFASWRGGMWRVILSNINVLHHFEDFSKGILDTSAIIFFISATIFFLFLAVKVLESRRWR